LFTAIKATAKIEGKPTRCPPFMYLLTIYLDPYLPDDGLYPSYTQGESISRKGSIKDKNILNVVIFPMPLPELQ
jgi:hypothetical protein